ncbi:MAG TPA: 4-hydroxyphenylacetate 3-hydroxylase N-terminal domain-containing protein [Hyphomicrobiaceae bacterium]|nr:4-hydroxyphenylacetate 3-hydroxylase N-terminal domain-containing protein [Hyphomicrobiaceae bacterium]
MSEAPEHRIAGKQRPFTGAEYLASLRDGRQVYIYGEKVRDVTRHPAFRNAAASVAKLYDALHDSQSKAVLTTDTDTGSGGYTHRFFKVARSRTELIGQRDAIAQWARLSYGWMGRSPDYKAAFLNTLGANADFYGKFAGNARAWHARGQNAVLYVNHALVNPPIDRAKPVEQVKDVYVSIEKETDAGIYVSGAKVVATNSALTHYNFLGQNMGQDINDESMVVMFMAPMDTPGLKLICRASYEMTAAATGSAWDYPLTSRFDENDAILVCDHAFIPWENVFIHRDVERLKAFYPRSGFVNGFTLQACTRFAVKLDFLAGLLMKAARATGVEAFRGVQTQIGEVIGWRNLFWALSDAMAHNPDPWVNGAVLPNMRASVAYRLFATEAYPAVRAIVEKVIASGLIYLPSHARDFNNPEIDGYLAKYVRGSGGIDYKARIKLMKLLWDAIGSEFGARHELYEMNYAGSHELVRLFPLQQAQASGALKEMEALVERCMADYDENGWRDPAYHAGEDISVLDRLEEPRT